MYAYFVIRWIKKVLGPLKTQEMCNAVVLIEPHSLEIVPDHFKAQGMCNEAVRREPYTLKYVPDHLKTRDVLRGSAQGATHARLCS